MAECLHDIIQVVIWFLFDMLPRLAVIPLGETGKQLIQIDACRYIIGTVIVLIATGVPRMIMRR